MLTLNCANLMRRFDFKEKNLTNEILKVLNTYLSDHSSQKKASYYGLSIKIDCKYEDIEAKADIMSRVHRNIYWCNIE